MGRFATSNGDRRVVGLEPFLVKECGRTSHQDVAGALGHSVNLAGSTRSPKRVSFNSVHEVITFSSDSSAHITLEEGSDEECPIVHFPGGNDIGEPQNESKLCRVSETKKSIIPIFYGNISSLSVKAQAYLFSGICSQYHALCEVEHHSVDSKGVIKVFRDNKPKAYVSPAQKTSEHGSHGGELLAFHKHLNTMPIEPEVINSIQQSTDGIIRFAAAYMRLESINIVVIALYLFVAEGMGLQNTLIMSQLDILRRVTGCPFICLGDFNMLPTELSDSVWLHNSDPYIKTTTSPTSTSASVDRRIDMCLYSRHLHPMIHDLTLVMGCPWSPHFGMDLSIVAKPRSIQGMVIAVPRPLPMEGLRKVWSSL